MKGEGSPAADPAGGFSPRATTWPLHGVDPVYDRGIETTDSLRHTVVSGLSPALVGLLFSHLLIRDLLPRADTPMEPATKKARNHRMAAGLWNMASPRGFEPRSLP